MKTVEDILRETMGLDAASIGSSIIERSARLRMKTLGMADLEAFKNLLESSPAELWTFVEQVLVTETWFFRDREPFAAFIKLVMEEWLPAHPFGHLRLLSLPCASGEEPYSLAMALLDAGIPAERFRIDAMDISMAALDRARRAVYGKNSFRGQGLAFRERYFDAMGAGFALKKPVRECVRFDRRNLVGDTFMPGEGDYDFVFCRNLLIYFDAASQQKAVRQIERLLSDSGFLFVGPAEQPILFEAGFISANIPMAFACRKPRTSFRAGPARTLHLEPRPQTAHPPQFQPNSGAAELSPISAGESDLEKAHRLADAGKLQEASAICENHLLEKGASAQAYYLLGLVYDARGRGDALDYYRKALYLEPNHYETLVQMALLSQKAGDIPRARTFRERAQRVKGRMPEELLNGGNQGAQAGSSKLTQALPTPEPQPPRNRTET
jgi:chemotaxis protein methyltransferase WspC